MNAHFWKDKRVFVTGHNGFKGSWLCLWLQSMGAKVFGYALSPPTEPNIFSVAHVASAMAMSVNADIRDYSALLQALETSQPEIVFHLAAQPLVRYSYSDPIETYSTNVMGTVMLFEAIRKVSSVLAIVNVTTDKCYENREWEWAYRENEPLGGYDPYSSSKGCSEILTAAWRSSYFAKSGVALASARAGNVIGGGDWALDRLLPDFLRALDNKETLMIRSPLSIRPWQHVLEPLSGYLLLAERLLTQGAAFAEAWNFGPADSDAKTVDWIVERLVSQLPGAKWECTDSVQPHEAHYLKLDSSKAHSRLGWKPRWQLQTALDRTVEWHKAWHRGEDMCAFSLQQLENYAIAKIS